MRLNRRMVQHLRSCGVLEPGHHLVVDLGWTGSSLADLADIVRARFDFDAAGHYARPDIFRLDVTRPAR